MTPYRLHYVSDIEGWAYWWVGLALREHAPQHVTMTIGCVDTAAKDSADADIVFDMVYQGVPELSRKLDPKTILVSGFNVGFKNRGMEMLPLLAANSTHVVCNNRECWIEAVKRGLLIPERSSFISIGTDRQKFRVRVPVEDRQDKILFGCSKGHAAWKGAEILRSMIPQFHKAGFNTDFVVVDSHGGPERMDQQRLADWYQTGRYYICLSELGMEGTPMPPLEAAASGCVVITTPVGSMPELIIDKWNGVILKDREPETIIEAVRYAREHRDRLAANMRESLTDWDWPARAKRYFGLFDRLIQRREQ